MGELTATSLQLTARGTAARRRLGALLFSCRLTAVSCLLLACTSALELHKGELALLAEWLPGRYDNLAQSRADGAATQEALALSIVPIYAPALGERVFYMQEMAANDPRRVLGQRILAFDATKEGVVQRTFALNEPGRWRDGHQNPDLFKSLMPTDVREQRGCELLWKKEGEQFTGANDRARCRASSRTTGGLVQIDSRAELGPGELALSDRSYASDGRLVEGRTGDAFYRFEKRAT